MSLSNTFRRSYLMAIPSWEIPWIFNMTATKIHCAGATVDNKYRIWKKKGPKFLNPTPPFEIPLLRLCLGILFTAHVQKLHFI